MHIPTRRVILRVLRFYTRHPRSIVAPARSISLRRFLHKCIEFVFLFHFEFHREYQISYGDTSAIKMSTSLISHRQAGECTHILETRRKRIEDVKISREGERERSVNGAVIDDGWRIV